MYSLELLMKERTVLIAKIAELEAENAKLLEKLDENKTSGGVAGGAAFTNISGAGGGGCIASVAEFLNNESPKIQLMISGVKNRYYVIMYIL
jgi:hypothetical protein